MKQTKTILAIAIVLTTISTSCKKSDSTTPDVPLPPIGGYNNSNEVGAANLKAHWSFEGVTKEDISGVDISQNLRNSFVTGGPKGKALRLDSGYIKYPVISGIQQLSTSGLASFTISCWVNMPNKGNSFTQLLTLAPSVTNADDVWGNINLGAETGWFNSTIDTLVPKTLIRPFLGAAVSNQDNRPDPKGTPSVGVFKVANQWAQVIVTFDAATSKLQIFGNEVHISAYDNRSIPAGAVFKNTDAIIIGSLLCSELGYTAQGANPSWCKWFTGSIDEIRVFNKALSVSEISALYQLEKVGR